MSATAYPRWLHRTIAALIVLGVVLRLYNFDAKVFWSDETMTALRMSGQTMDAMIAEVYNGEPHTTQFLLETYQMPSPDRDLADVMTALKGNPEHSPLYYLLTRWWVQVWGSSTAVMRSLAVIFSLLSLPCMYWLGLELFGDRRLASVATALIAVSPFHILYGQEAREYSLWIVSILASSAVLLRAVRTQRWGWWTGYAGMVAFSLYTHPFSAFVIAGHGFYVLLSKGIRRNPALIRFLLAVIVGLILFLPWAQVIISGYHEVQDNTDFLTSTRDRGLYLFWGRNLSRLFFDFNQGTSLLNPALWLLVALVLYAGVDLVRRTPLPTWLFVVTLVGVLGTALIGSDLGLGGQRSTITRYAVPAYLGIQLAVAHLVGTRLSAQAPSRSAQPRWYWAFGLLTVSLVASSVVQAHFPVWWHKSHNKSFHNPAIAAILNDRPAATLISDMPPHWVLPVLHLLNDEVVIHLTTAPQLPVNIASDRDVYLYRPSPWLRDTLTAAGWTITDAHESRLWSASRPS